MPVIMAGFVAASCSKPEKLLESGRSYMSITYTDTTLESFGRSDQAITGVLIERLADSVRFRFHTKDQSSAVPQNVANSRPFSRWPENNSRGSFKTSLFRAVHGTEPTIC